MRDAEWIAELLRHGLIRASFVPERAERELRELVRERTNELNRIAKVPEGANIKLALVASVGGASSRAILAALVAGESDAAAMAELARDRLRDKREALAAALTGSIGAHQRFVLGVMLRHIGELDGRIGEVSAEIAARLQPHEAQLVALTTIPGIGRRLAEVLLAEVGTDMARFPSARHLASWAGMCPGNDESAGKRVTSVKVVYERRFIRRVSDYPAAASTGITSSVNSSPRRTRRALVSDSALM